MRKLFALTLLAFACGAAGAADKKPALGIGDKAPALKVTKWVQGEEVKDFAAGKVYVVEFWATWCTPCIAAMPHLEELQAEFKKDLVVIGMTSKDMNGNDQTKVEKFVEKNKGKFTYRFAFAEDRDTDKAFMEASEQNGIPCSFVIDKAGKIAYIGHPMELDEVLPKVVAGTWKGKEDVDALAAASKELDSIMSGAEREATKEMPEGSDQLREARSKAAADALPKLAEFEKGHPVKGAQDMFRVQKMVMLMKAKKYDDAKSVGEAMLAKSVAKKTAIPGVYTGMIFGNKELNPDKKHLDLAGKALDTVLEFEPKDVGLLLAAVELQMFVGNKEKAAEFGKKAVAAAEDDKTKKEVEGIVEKALKGDGK